MPRSSTRLAFIVSLGASSTNIWLSSWKSCRNTFNIFLYIENQKNFNFIKTFYDEGLFSEVNSISNIEKLKQRECFSTECDFESEGILNNIELKFPNEPARHKLLDIVGDLTLVGKSIKGKIIAKRPGHKANVELGKLIKEKTCYTKRQRDIIKQATEEMKVERQSQRTIGNDSSTRW